MLASWQICDEEQKLQKAPLNVLFHQKKHILLLVPAYE